MNGFTDVIANYNKIYNTYIDEHQIIDITEKTPAVGTVGEIVAGDVNSQFITFKIKRYYDNIDLSNKLIKVSYTYKKEERQELELKKFDPYAYSNLRKKEEKHHHKEHKPEIYSDNACNICYNDDFVCFSWLLPAEASLKEGVLLATISFIGLNDEEGYNLQSKIFELKVNPAIISNDELEKIVKVSWFEDVESRIYKLEQATGGADLDYATLINKPSINGSELNGDMTLDFISGIATTANLGGVKAVAKTAEMTYAIGIDSDGYLWTKPGAGGAGGNGEDGFSPIVTMTAAPDGTGTTLAILDKNGLKTAFINNGTNGTNGIDGTNGTDGADGTDGISPIVTITEITGGNRLSITDKDGLKYADIFDGKAVIDDAATSGSESTWSIDKIISYVQTTLEDIENGTY